MLSSERETFLSLQLLDVEVKARRRPLVIWVGAGVSSWAGYPLWYDLAAQMHSELSRTEFGYDSLQGAQFLESGDFPSLFEQMRQASSARYLGVLSRKFQPASVSPVFDRFLRTLAKISPLRLLTTNVDEMLERHIKDVALLQRSDFERAVALQNNSDSYICKLHGSVSSAESMVFSASDYAALMSDQNYLRFLRQIFSDSNVVFFGYSVRDEYVIKELLAASGDRPLFGSGEYFVVCPEGMKLPLELLRPIRYVVDERMGHRAGLQVLDAIVSAIKAAPELKSEPSTVATQDSKSTAYFIADLIPPGRWQTSQSVRFSGPDGLEPEMLVGGGFVDGEVQLSGYSAMHDIVVGLLCFDKICFALESLGKVHSLLGSDLFWRLVDEGAIHVVHSTNETVLIYRDSEAVAGGDLGNVQLLNQGFSTEKPAPMSVLERIGRVFTATPGREDEARQLYERLARITTVLPVANTPDMVRGALAHPTLRSLLGISGGTPATAIPRWVAYPVLRLAGVIATGQFCQHLDASATRLLWGSERLATAAFAAASGEEWADESASYILTGRIHVDLGDLVSRDADAMQRILNFRQSQSGEGFRREVGVRLATNEGGELAASVNLVLRKSLSLSVLEGAREQLSGLFTLREPVQKMTPAVWGDVRNGDQRIAQWRRRSRKLLTDACEKLRIGPYDQCPCGSGEKLKFCCQEALSK